MFEEKIRKVKVLDGRAYEKAMNMGLDGKDTVLIETEITQGELPEYKLTKIEGSPTEFIKDKMLDRDNSNSEGKGEEEQVMEELPIKVDLPLGWFLKWQRGLVEGSIVRNVYDEQGGLIDSDIVSCVPIPEAIPIEEEIEIIKDVIVSKYNLSERAKEKKEVKE